MLKNLRIFILFIAKYIGVFPITRIITKNGLRILAYHGISLVDEHRFQSQLFMSEPTFKRRLGFLAQSKCRLLPLGLALQLMDRGELPALATVITIDDGWFGTYAKGVRALKDHDFPATIYVTTYYAQKETQVFNVLVRYLFWRTEKGEIDLSALGCGLSGTFHLTDPAQRERAVEAVVKVGDNRLGAEKRQSFARALAVVLAVDFDSLQAAGALRLMTLDQIRQLAESGIDFQLHTHRHRMPFHDQAELSREIEENRRILTEATGNAPTHLCYPSGEYHPRAWPWLETLKVESATTTAPGFCYRDTPRYELPRFLDGENISQIEFEAELCGFLELLRRGRSSLARLRRGVSQRGLTTTTSSE